MEQVHESEQAQELTLKRVEAERAERQRLNDAIATAHVSISFCNIKIIAYVLSLQTIHIAKSSNLLSYLRLHSLFSAGHPSVLSLDLNDKDSSAVFAVGTILLGDEGDKRQAVLSGIMSGEGEYIHPS